MKILVVGAGYVGLAYASFFLSKYRVDILEINKKKVTQINSGKSPIVDDGISEALKNKPSNICAITSVDKYSCYEFILLCLPTDYDEFSNTFDTSLIEDEIKKINKLNFDGIIVIKSTIPVGFTDKLAKRFKNLNFIFSPEFLREGSALTDIQNPSRVVAGGSEEYINKYFDLIKSCLDIETEYLNVNFTEAEAIKLFSNTFLAMRVSFFNELDSYCIEKGLSSKDIIDGVCKDDRIGNFYNNPSFGYGGYCLPKDTKQLLKNYENVPQSLISSIVKANEVRKDFLARHIVNKGFKHIGIYGLAMKKNSDNFRESSVISIINRLKTNNLIISIYEPALKESNFEGCQVIDNFDDFQNQSEIIIANRYNPKLDKIKDKVFTRDIFHED